MKDKKKSKSYKALRDYVKNELDLSATTLEQDLSKELGMSVKSIQSVGRDKRDFKWSEAKTAALFFIKKCKGKNADVVVLRSLVYNFLITYGTIDQDAEITEAYINSLLDQEIGQLHPVSSQTPSNDYRFSNLPQLRHNEQIIRHQLYDFAQKGISNHKIIFFSGFPGTGKSFIANKIAREYYNNSSNNYKVAIWNDCRNGNISFNDFIVTILSSFKQENTGNLSMNEKIVIATQLLLSTKTLIVVDGFECLCSDMEKEEVLSFLAEKASEDTLVIITCSERLSVFRKVINNHAKFKEIVVENFTPSAWKLIAQNMSEARSDIAEAHQIIPELDDYVYTLCKGNPYLMIHTLSAISVKICTGISFAKIRDEYELPDIDNQSYNFILEKSISMLSDNNMCLLIALSLFVVPVTLQELSKVSGLSGIDQTGNLIDGSPLAASILQCHNLYLVNQYYSQNTIKYSLYFMVRAIMQVKSPKYDALRREIVERWIAYYIDFSKQIGFCFDNFNRLEILDSDSNAREIENIKTVLSYCEQHKLWKEFYIISENTKYFFYTRGISGYGDNSIHFHRSLAAQYLCDYQAEYDSLVYHCNVSCKSHSWDNIDKCFDRLDYLDRKYSNIAYNSRLKYQYTKGLYYYSKGIYKNALEIFTAYEKQLEVILKKIEINEDTRLIVHDYVASLRWHSECLLREANESDSMNHDNIINEINHLLSTSVSYAKKTNFQRAITHSLLIQANAYLTLKKDYKKGEQIMNDLEKHSSIIENDARYTAEYNELRKRLSSR